jgi:tetratricopeptide (TPR) repeat protein
VGSVRLFADRAADASPGFEIDADNARSVAELCHRLDGMPLALELGAARVGVLSPEQILQRLRVTLGVLGPGRRGAFTRQRTLVATLAWSHDLLTPDERVLFRRLAVFAGSFSLEAAEQVCGAAPLAPEGVLDLLGRLVDKSLVGAEGGGGPNRYRLLETVRQYARERLGEAGEREPLERAHRAWYSAFAQQHDPEREPDRAEASPRRLDPEHDNLREALRSSLARDPEGALRLAASVWRYWLARGYFAEGRRWLETALSAAPAASELRARALMGVAILNMRSARDIPGLQGIANEIVAIHEELGDAVALAHVRHLAGILCWIGGWDDPDRLIRAALADAERLGAAHVVATAEHASGIMALERGEPVTAHERFERAGAKLADLGDVRHAFFPALTQGFVLERDERGRPRLSFQETMVLGHRLGAAQGTAFLPSNAARAARADRDLDAAVALARESARWSARLGWRYGEALALCLLGNLHRARGEYAEARDRLERSLALRRELGDRRATGLALGCLGLLASAQGDVDRARASLRAALELFERIEDVPGTMGSLLNLGVVALRAGERTDARTLLERSGARVEGLPRAGAWIQVMLAEIAREEGDHRAAMAHLFAARAGFERLREREGLAHCREVVSVEQRLSRV